MRIGNTTMLIQITAHWLFWECSIISSDMLFCLHFQMTIIKFNFGATRTSSAQLKSCSETWQVCGTRSAGTLFDRIETRLCIRADSLMLNSWLDSGKPTFFLKHFFLNLERIKLQQSLHISQHITSSATSYLYKRKRKESKIFLMPHVSFRRAMLK